MLNKFVGSIRGVGRHRTGFDSYLVNVQRGSRGGPKIDEARRDFARAILSRYEGYYNN